MGENLMKFLVLGAGGMAGHTIAIYLSEQGEYVEGVAMSDLSFCKTYIMDVTNFNELEKLIKSNSYDVVINCIGILNQNAENNKAQAILLNSYLPHFLAKITEDTNTRIFQMSTDCVFSGKRGNYTEFDYTDGETYYDRTKALGELNDKKNLTFRNSIIGPDINLDGIGLLNWFMKQDEEVSGFEKSIWTGVTTLTLAKAMHVASHEDIVGLYNLVNNKITNKYELLTLFNKYSNKNIKINKVEGIMQDKSLYRTRNDFSFIVPAYDMQIKEMFDWISLHKDLYRHYFKGDQE